MVEMAVLGDDVIGSSGDGAVHEFIIVLVDVAKQMETEEGLTIDNQRMIGLFIRRAQMLAAQFVEFLLVEDSLVPHLVDSLLCPLSEEEREGEPQCIKFFL